MSMQDNEFDALFQAKLDGFEMEPSAPVWDNIDAELNGKKRRIAILPWLSIAASIIVLITAGMLFIPKKVTIKNGRPDKNELAHTAIKPAVVTQSVAKPTNTTPVTEQVTKEEQVVVAQVSHTPVNKVHAIEKQEVTIDPKQQDAPVIAKTEPVKVDEQPILADATPKRHEQINAVVPDAGTPLVKPTAIETTNQIQQQPVLAAAQLPATTDSKVVKPVVKHHGIHNMGDLVNLVVAKVDKRKDKIIQFSDGEEESTITGVHIGAIDIKREAK